MACTSPINILRMSNPPLLSVLSLVKRAGPARRRGSRLEFAMQKGKPRSGPSSGSPLASSAWDLKFVCLYDAEDDGGFLWRRGVPDAGALDLGTHFRVGHFCWFCSTERIVNVETSHVRQTGTSVFGCHALVIGRQTTVTVL